MARFLIKEVHLFDLTYWTNLRGRDIGLWAVVDGLVPPQDQVIALFEEEDRAQEALDRLVERMGEAEAEPAL